MLLMRAWGSRAGPADAHDARPLGASVATQKTTKKKPFTGGTRGSAALASGLILLRRRPEASKAIPGTTRAKRSAFARSFGDLALPDLMATASAADPLQGGPRHCGLRPRIMYREVREWKSGGVRERGSEGGLGVGVEQGPYIGPALAARQVEG